MLRISPVIGVSTPKNRPIRYSCNGPNDFQSAATAADYGTAAPRGRCQKNPRVAGGPGYDQVHQRASARGLPHRGLQLAEGESIPREKQLYCSVKAFALSSNQGV